VIARGRVPPRALGQLADLKAKTAAREAKEKLSPRNFPDRAALERESAASRLLSDLRKAARPSRQLAESAGFPRSTARWP
jgi:hypothetical protein